MITLSCEWSGQHQGPTRIGVLYQYGCTCYVAVLVNLSVLFLLDGNNYTSRCSLLAMLSLLLYVTHTVLRDKLKEPGEAVSGSHPQVGSAEAVAAVHEQMMVIPLCNIDERIYLVVSSVNVVSSVIKKLCLEGNYPNRWTADGWMVRF
jgi:hypothetical protein